MKKLTILFTVLVITSIFYTTAVAQSSYFVQEDTIASTSKVLLKKIASYASTGDRLALYKIFMLYPNSVMVLQWNDEVYVVEHTYDGFVKVRKRGMLTELWMAEAALH